MTMTSRTLWIWSFWLSFAACALAQQTPCKYCARAFCPDSSEDRGCSFTSNETSIRYYDTGSNTSDYTVDFTASRSFCGFDQYHISVWSYKNVTQKETCVGIDHGDDELDENIHNVDIPVGNMTCHQITLSFRLRYLINGCYFFSVRPMINYNSQKPVKHTLWFSNGTTDGDLNITTPFFMHFNYRTYLSVRWEFKNRTLLRNNNYVIKSVKDMSDMKKEVQPNITCKTYDYYVNCDLMDLPAGKYMIFFELVDHWRCKISTMPYGVCSWNATIERIVSPNVSQYSAGEPIHPYKWYGGILTAIVVFLLCFISLVSWIFYKKRKVDNNWPDTFDNRRCTNGSCHITDNGKVKGIFLLYARDCEPFMELMVKFRKLLSSRTDYNIYDIFDEERFNEIAVSPFEWVQYLIEEPNIKVILVATECADVLYKNLMRHFRYPSESEDTNCLQLYTNPNCMDNVFIHSLKLISFDTTPVPYHKYFVVRFPKFNKNNDDHLSHVSPHKRFDLPDCLELLIKNISEHSKTQDEWCDSSNSLHSVAYDSASRDVLSDGVKSLFEYVKTNPSYIKRELLNSDVIYA